MCEKLFHRSSAICLLTVYPNRSYSRNEKVEAPSIIRSNRILPIEERIFFCPDFLLLFVPVFFFVPIGKKHTFWFSRFDRPQQQLSVENTLRELSSAMRVQGVGCQRGWDFRNSCSDVAATLYVTK